MTLQDPKRHHFIPQFYLRAWARGDGRLTWFYRPHSKVEAVSRYPKAVGFDTNLYAYEGVPEDKRQILEKELFHPVDTHAAETHKLLLGGKLNALSNENRVHWARFLLSTQLRTPFGLQELKRLADQTLRANLGVKNDAEFNALRKLGDPETIYEWTQKYQPQVIENAHKQFLPGLIDHEDLGHYLINMQWATVGLAHAIGPSYRLTAGKTRTQYSCFRYPRDVFLWPRTAPFAHLKLLRSQHRRSSRQLMIWWSVPLSIMCSAIVRSTCFSSSGAFVTITRSLFLDLWGKAAPGVPPTRCGWLINL
jgi:hypothetical protein